MTTLLSMLAPDEDDFLPELPPLLDDGESSTDVEADEVGFDDEARGSAWDDDSVLDGLAEESLDDLPDEDDSWLDDSTAELDDEPEAAEEAEYGFLDDAPVSDLDLGDLSDGETESGIVGDSGEEGTDEPLGPGSDDDDDDASHLPALKETDEEDEEPADDDDDLLPGTTDEPPASRRHDRG